MKYTPINNYTKAKIISTIQTKMLDHVCVNKQGIPAYRASDGNHCVWGCFVFHSDGTFAQPLSSIAPLRAKVMSELMNLHDRNFRTDNSDRRPRLIKWIRENVE